jgi:hypothetical protein
MKVLVAEEVMKKEEMLMIMVKQKNTRESIREIIKIMSVYVVPIFGFFNKQLTTQTYLCLVLCALEVLSPVLMAPFGIYTPLGFLLKLWLERTDDITSEY